MAIKVEWLLRGTNLLNINFTSSRWTVSAAQITSLMFTRTLMRTHGHQMRGSNSSCRLNNTMHPWPIISSCSRCSTIVTMKTYREITNKSLSEHRRFSKTTNSWWQDPLLSWTHRHLKHVAITWIHFSRMSKWCLGKSTNSLKNPHPGMTNRLLSRIS